MSGVKELFGSGVVVDKSGNAVDLDSHCAGKQVGLYFSAHWCPPCRGFTSKLAEIYLTYSENFEIIFVSSDRDEDSFNEYYDQMPWLALKYNDRNVKDALARKYDIRGIPTLIVVDSDTGSLITKNGRDQVLHHLREGRFKQD